MKLFRYLIIGSTSALIELSIFSIIHRIFGLGLIESNLIALFIVIVYGFLMHKNWTFNYKGKSRTAFYLFLFMVSIAIILNNSLLYIFVTIIYLPPEVAKILQICLVFLWNYSFSSLIVFSNKQNPIQNVAQ